MKIKNAKSSLAKRNFEKLFSNKLATIGGAVTIIIIVLCICAPLLTQYSPTSMVPADKNQLFSDDHILGTDQVGRDIWSRLLYGGRVSIFVGLASAVGANFLGIFTGCIAGYCGGKTDGVLVYINELFTSFPQTLLVLIIVGFLGQGIHYLVLVFSLTGWTNPMRVVRSRIISLKEEPYVESCVANGIGTGSIIFRHLLPNTLGIVIVNFTSSVATFVLAEAALSFLGIGVPSGTPTWGNMLNAAKSLQVMYTHPHLWIIPGIAISLFVLSINFFGDGLRDVFDVTQ